jgi:hypothetical protein
MNIVHRQTGTCMYIYNNQLVVSEFMELKNGVLKFEK